MRSFLILIPFLFLYNAANSQSLYFVDGENSLPIQGVEVKAMDSRLLVVSNEQGIASLKGNSEEKVMVQHPSYIAQIIKVNLNEEQQVIKLAISPKVLDEVKVLGFDNRKAFLETPASIGSISNKDIQRFNGTSLVPAINNIAGVRMEERSPGSYRLSIRGSLLRSPFGVRNVKVYWNGIPFTEPGGNTPFNLLDVSNMANIEVLKGPASSIYGAGTGGVVNISSFPSFQENYVEAGFTTGSFGLQRYTGSVQYNDEKQSILLNYSNMGSDGYRDHSAMERQTVDLNARFKVSDKRIISANLLYSDLFYQIPGGINVQDFEENPRQARQGSASQNSSINLSALTVGLTHDYQFNKLINNTTTIYTTNSFFDHPFIMDYKRDIQNGAGGRTKFTYNESRGPLPFSVNLGAEYQTLKVVARNFGNIGGTADTLRFDDEITTSQGTVFAQAEVDLPAKFYLNAGLSLNTLNYDIYRLQDKIIHKTYRYSRDVPFVIAPRIGLVKKFENNSSVYGSISKGFSPPTVQELRTNEGTINEGLEAERGFNYEVGFRGNTFFNILNYNISLFNMDLRETIVSRVSESGVVIFNNSGATSQRGLEISGDMFLIDDPLKNISRLKLSSAFTYYDFVFKNYVRDDNDYSGNKLTGVPQKIFTASLDVESKVGLYLNLNYNYTDEIPLNDANDVYSDAYNLLLLKAGYQRMIKKLHFNIYAGVDNLLNETYSLGNDLNAFGGRYFQTAPERNYFTGMKVKYLFDGN